MADIADRYRRLADRFSAVVAAVPADRWDAPSPCEGWTATDVVRHVVDTESEFVGRLGLAELPATDADAHPAATWPTVNATVQRLLDDPATAGHAYDGFFGPTTFEATVDQFYSLDLLVHAWDVARAAGLAELEPMPAEDVTASFAAMRPMGDVLRQPGLCGPEVEVPDDADEQTRFLAFLGRRA